MSFASLKKSSQTSMKTLAEQLGKEKAGGSYAVDTRFWTPDIDKAGNGYAVIRFLPAPDDHDMPYVKTYSHGFKIGQKWFIENCPTTIGGECPVCEANSVLWDTGVKANKDIASNRARQLQYVGNILVISDSKRPENEGKVFLFKYGKKIFEKVSSAIEPLFEDEKAINPYDFWLGANFKLKIRQHEGFRNYDMSAFEPASALLDGDDEALEALWKKEYALKEFVEPKQYKGNAELKAKFDQVVSGVPSQASAQVAERNNDAVASHQAASQSPRREAAPEAAAAPAAAPAGNDDAMAAYHALLADD